MQGEWEVNGANQWIFHLMQFLENIAVTVSDGKNQILKILGMLKPDKVIFINPSIKQMFEAGDLIKFEWYSTVPNHSN